MEKAPVVVVGVASPAHLLPSIQFKAVAAPFQLRLASAGRPPALSSTIEAALEAKRRAVVGVVDELLLQDYAVGLEALFTTCPGDWHLVHASLGHGPAPPYATLLGEYGVVMFALAAHVAGTKGAGPYAAALLRRAQSTLLKATTGDQRLVDRRLRDASMVGSAPYYTLLADWLDGRRDHMAPAQELERLAGGGGGGEATIILETVDAVQRHESALRARALDAHFNTTPMKLAEATEGELVARGALLWLAVQVNPSILFLVLLYDSRC